MQHLIRAGVLLVILVIGLFLAHEFFVPESFGEHGFYRGENVEEWASWPMQYASLPQCGDCHQQRYDTWVNSRHGGVICENCHGPAQVHAETGAELTVEVSRDLCGFCHAEIFGRRSDFPQVDIDQHGGQALCMTCHDPHDPHVPGAVLSPMIPHGAEGMLDCLICHTVGGAGVGESGGTGLSADHKGTPIVSCLECHEHE